PRLPNRRRATTMLRMTRAVVRGRTSPRGPFLPRRGASRLPTLFAVSIGALCLAGCRERAPSADLISENNRGVGLMGPYDFGQAREVFAALAASHPDRRDIQVNLAVATLNRQQDGDADAAQQILQRVLAADPQDVRAHYDLGLVLLNEGRAAEALTHFTFVADRDRGDAYAEYYVGQCRWQQRDVAGALGSYERALAIHPRLRSAAYGAFLARQRLGRGDAPQMLDRFRALEADPRSDVVEF